MIDQINTTDPTPENDNTPEKAAVATLSVSAERIFQEYPSTPPFSHPDEPEPVDVVEQISKGNVDFQRSTSPQGEVTYRLMTLWHHGVDRGAFVQTWQKDGAAVGKETRSEMGNNSDETQVDVASIQFIEAEINRMFPPVEVVQKKSALKTLLGTLARKKS